MGSTSSVLPPSPSQHLQMPSYYIHHSVNTSDRSNCTATWVLITSDESSPSRMALLQYYLDSRMIEFLPDMDTTHTSGVVSLMLTHVFGPNTFLLNEGNLDDFGWLKATGNFLRSSGFGREDFFCFGSSLFSALKSVCGDLYNEVADVSWKRFYSFLLRYLLASGEEEEGSLCKEAVTTFRSSSPTSANHRLSQNFALSPRQERGVKRCYARKENCILLDSTETY